MSHDSQRRKVLKQLGAATITTAAAALSVPVLNAQALTGSLLKGNIKQSVCAWTYGFLSLEQLCDVALELGLGAIDLVAPKDFGLFRYEYRSCQ